MTVTFLAAPFLTLFFFQSGAEASFSDARALRQVAIERADRKLCSWQNATRKRHGLHWKTPAGK